MTKDDRLFNIAAACVQANAEGCDGVCGGCEFNLYKFTDANTAGIMLANARANFNNWNKQKKIDDANYMANIMGPLIAVIIILGMIFWLLSKCGF